MNPISFMNLVRAVCFLYFVVACLMIHRVESVLERERSKALTSDGTAPGKRRYNDTTSFYASNVTMRYVPKPLLHSSSSICKLCNDTWSIPRPNFIVRGRTCSYWNNLFQQENCPMYQSTYGAVCGCAHSPDPPCPVCYGYGDYIWTVGTNSHASYIVDQCIQMILDLSVDNHVCSSYRRFVSKLCCTHPPTSDDYLRITDKLRSDDHYVAFGGDDYSYVGPVYDDYQVHYDDYYLGHGKAKNKKKGPKHRPYKDPKKKMKKNVKKSKWYHDDYQHVYSKSKSKQNPYHDDIISHYY